jgi:hypothetical protein
MAVLNLTEINETLTGPSSAPLPGGVAPSRLRCRVYFKGTEQLARLFSDAALTDLRANPINADASGHFISCHVMNGDYDLVVTTEDENTKILETTVSTETKIAMEQFTAAGSGTAAVVGDDISIRSGEWVSMVFSENSEYGLTLNGSPVRIKDIYATEQSRWNIVSGSNAAPSYPKTDVWRPVYRGMISSDVPYMVRYDKTDGFFEIQISKLYKHVFIPTGNGADIPELQDVFGFISQFERGTAMDPQFMQSDSSTNFYPNKAQISITLPCGPAGNPLVSTFTKQVRVGENSLNGVEIINETRYEDNRGPELCIAEYSGPLNDDDLAFLNIWKCDLGEIRGITWRFTGTFTENNQCVVRFNRATARLKRCRIDISGATIAPGVDVVSGVYWDDANECFDNTVVCHATTQQGCAAYHIASDSNSPGSSVEGRAQYVFRLSNKLQVSNLRVTDPCDTLVDVFGPAELTLAGTSTDLSGVTNVHKSNGYTVAINAASGMTLFPELDKYAGGRIVHGDPGGVSSTVAPTFLVDHPVGGAKVVFSANGNRISGIGHFASTSGLELSGNGVARHMRVSANGHVEAGSDNAYNFGTASKRWAQVYAADGTVNTSDEREKTDIRKLSEAEHLVAVALKGELRAFRWREAVDRKGDEARIHFGVMAQKVAEAFQAQGLDATRYGVFCHDVWEDDEGATHERLGVRYGELLAFILAAL